MTRHVPLLVLALAVSAQAQSPLVGRPFGTPSRPYRRAHSAVTEKLVVYVGFPTALLMRATLFTPEFQRAMALEQARLLGPIQHAPARVQDDTWLEPTGVIEIVFTADSSMPFGTEFAPNARGWSLALEADGISQRLISVDHVRRPSPTQFSLYPQTNVWSELWIARFERTVPTPTALALHVGSGYGHGTLTWTRTDRQVRRITRTTQSLAASVEEP